MNSNELLKGHFYVRILNEQRNEYTVLIDGEEEKAVITGKYRYQLESKGEAPAVGDWAEVSFNPLESKARIHRIKKRKSVLLRKTAGSFAGDQVVAANLDRAFIVNSLNRDLNLRRMERYLVMVRDGGIEPILILSKSDLVEPDQRKEILKEVERIAGDAPIHITSMKRPWSLKLLSPYFNPGETIAFIGSSGVGKSTLVNFFLEEEIQDTGSIRFDDDKGKHTTTSRSLYQMKNGSFLIDTPGIREIQLWDGEGGLDETFNDILEAISECRFSNCRHENEPGCSLRESLENGDISEDRYTSFLKLRREQAFLERKKDARSLGREKEIWKQRSKEYRRGRKIYRLR